MLEVELAEKIIDKLSGVTDYNINIMNEQGIIVASKDKSRIGTFHEVAFEIVNKKLDYKEVEAEDTFLGTKPGINMALEYKKKIIGVLGLTGQDNTGEIRSVAFVIKKMLETVLEYEYQKEKAQKRRTDKERFYNALLYEEANGRDLLHMASALGYSDVSRLPILICFKNAVNIGEMSEKIRGGVYTGDRMTSFLPMQTEGSWSLKATRNRSGAFLKIINM